VSSEQIRKKRGDSDDCRRSMVLGVDIHVFAAPTPSMWEITARNDYDCPPK
jgi:hypothetical protein